VTMPSCTQFERYVGPAADAAWTTHVAGCPDCLEMQRRHAQLIAALQARDRIRGPRPDWQQEVFRGLDSRRQPPGHRIGLRWLQVACVAAAIIIVVWYTRRPHDGTVTDQQHKTTPPVSPPGPAALFARAKALLAEGNKVEALPALRGFVARRNGNAIDRAEAARLIQILESELADVDIRCDLPGISIFVDGEFRGKTPLGEPLVLTPGTHRVELRKGTQRWLRSMDFHAGKNGFYVPTSRTE